MAFCTKCGSTVPEGDPFCSNCGAAMPTANTPVGTPVANATVPGKGFAIASMVCGIVSFFCFGIVLGVLAVIFGAVAKNKGYVGGMATSGIVMGVIGLALYLLLLIIGGSAALIPFASY